MSSNNATSSVSEFSATTSPPKLRICDSRIANADQTSYLDYSSPYLQKVIDAGGWARYESLHLDKLTAMLTPKAPTDGRRRSRRRLSPLRRLPPEVLRKIVAYAFHAGYY